MALPQPSKDNLKPAFTPAYSNSADTSQSRFCPKALPDPDFKYR